MLTKAMCKYVNLKTVKKFNYLRFLDLTKCLVSLIVILWSYDWGYNWDWALLENTLFGKKKLLMEGVVGVYRGYQLEETLFGKSTPCQWK